MIKIKVVAYPRASVLLDGSLIELELGDQDKERVTLQFAPEDLDRFLARAIHLIAEARNRKHAKLGHSGVPVLATSAAGAGPAEEGSQVVVFLQTNTGTKFHFVLPTHAAETLAGNITAAVASAREQAAQTRQ